MCDKNIVSIKIRGIIMYYSVCCVDFTVNGNAFHQSIVAICYTYTSQNIKTILTFKQNCPPICNKCNLFKFFNFIIILN